MVTWTGFEDEESGIASFSVAIASDTGCDVPAALDLVPSRVILPECTLHSLNGSLLATLPWKVIGNGSLTNFSYSMSQGETLSSTLRYVVLVMATNRAGASVVAASPSIMLDNTLPQTGAIKDGADFRSDVVYQHESNRIAATWTQVYTTDQLVCPIFRSYSFLSENADWTVLSRFCRAGICSPIFPNSTLLLGDGVTYDKERVSFDPISGLLLSLVHPRADLSYTGAVFTQMIGAVDGTYTVVLQAAPDPDIISSILWWGANAQDLREPFFNPQQGSNPASLAFDYIITHDNLGNSIYTLFTVDAIGIQFVRVVSGVNDTSTLGVNNWMMVVWSSSISSAPLFNTVPLTFDPSASTHEYSIVLVTGLGQGVGSQGDVYIDGQWQARFFSFPAMQNPLFGFDLYPRVTGLTSVPVFRVAAATIPNNEQLLCRVRGIGHTSLILTSKQSFYVFLLQRTDFLFFFLFSFFSVFLFFFKHCDNRNQENVTSCLLIRTIFEIMICLICY